MRSKISHACTYHVLFINKKSIYLFHGLTDGFIQENKVGQGSMPWGCESRSLSTTRYPNQEYIAVCVANHAAIKEVIILEKKPKMYVGGINMKMLNVLWNDHSPIEIVEKAENIEGQFEPTFSLAFCKYISIHDTCRIIQTWTTHYRPIFIPV